MPTNGRPAREGLHSWRFPASGPWGLCLLSLVAMFALAPRLSDRMGEFWSQAVILPIWVAFYALTRILQLRREVHHDRG